MQKASNRTLLLRIGAASIGLLVGLPLGLLVALVATLVQAIELMSFAGWIFSTATVIAVACFFAPHAPLQALPWVTYFFLGAIPNDQNWKKHAGLRPTELTEARYRFAFRVGIIFSIIIAVVISYMATNSSG